MLGLESLLGVWSGVGTLLVAWTNRATLRALWREPALRRPVLVLESDDWGAGPLEQAARLERIADILSAYTDYEGRRAVMTLGLVLGVADGPRIIADELRNHHRKSLADVDFVPVLTAIRNGVARSVFAPQLHGGEHYWPAALLAVARHDQGIVDWLHNDAGMPSTEALPAELQSRWIDSSELPSKPLDANAIRAAALAEATEYRELFGRDPIVAVPPTFIWNDAVESAWAEAGVRVVVTPGRRYTARTAHGGLGTPSVAIFNGAHGMRGIAYVVRDDYFEPARGHRAERALNALATKTRLGRPTLLETHRANFLGDPANAEAAARELERLLDLALERFPNVAFLSTEELASRMRLEDPWLVERGLGVRLHVWLRRLWRVGRLRKLACVSGAIFPGYLLYALTRGSESKSSTV